MTLHVTNPRGRGFVVETPQGQVTDLGTEFGVDVAGDSNTDVVVFEGAVNLAYEKDLSEEYVASSACSKVKG